VAGVRLAAVDESTELATDRLDRISAAQVEQGIVAANRSDAERIVDRLVERFPSCDASRPHDVGAADALGHRLALRRTRHRVGASPSPAGSPSASPAPSASASADAATACPAAPRDRAGRDRRAGRARPPRRGHRAGAHGLRRGIAVLAYAAVGLAVEDRVPEGTLGYGAGLAVLFLVAHLAVRRFAPYADPLILPCVALLNGLGLVMIRRLDFQAPSAPSSWPVSCRAPRRPASWCGPPSASSASCWCSAWCATTRSCSATPTPRCGRAGPAAAAGAARAGPDHQRRAAVDPVGPFTLQPSEVAKLLLIVFFASYLVAKRDVLSLASRRVLAWTCRVPATSVPCCWPGRPASPCWCGARTSAARCCSSPSSS
jgi:hypothetical protein